MGHISCELRSFGVEWAPYPPDPSLVGLSYPEGTLLLLSVHAYIMSPRLVLAFVFISTPNHSNCGLGILILQNYSC